jgi:hypothetical protein
MKYNTFLWVFILSIISGIVFLVYYMQAIFSIARMGIQHETAPDPFAMLATIFTPEVIISLAVAAITGLVYRIIGIVCVVKNKIASGGEKALWIVGFILLGFVTGIVFLALAKSRKLVGQEDAYTA